jgi:hypothetical protein
VKRKNGGFGTLGTKCGQIEAEASFFGPVFARLNSLRHLTVAICAGLISMSNSEAQNVFRCPLFTKICNTESTEDVETWHFKLVQTLPHHVTL